MKSPYINQLEPNQVITSVFLVQAKDIRQKKSGEPYLSLMLGDRTGDIEAKMWDNVADVMHTFERDDFVKVKGLFQIFQNRRQISIHKMIRIDDRDVDFADFFPASERDPEEMWADLRAIIAGIGNPHLKALLESIFADERVARAFKIAPAAKMIHHAYLGGLIEHVLSLCKLGRAAAAHYKDVDSDLLIAGVILHDIGKIEELTYERGFAYSTDGQLLGHIAIGVRMIEDHVRLQPDFPPTLRTLLEHMILSHHGELAYGSPKVPLFPEALLLHHLDNLDSKMECMRSQVDKDRQYEGCWTSYSPSLERAVLKKLKYLEEDGQASIADQPAAGSAPADPPESAALVPESERFDARPADPPSEPRRSGPSSSAFGDKLKQALQTSPKSS
jgi:3'-5' exoribonuclease